MRSPRRIFRERIKDLCRPEGRFFDIGAKLQVWGRAPTGDAIPGEILPKLYGGVYDLQGRRYVRASEHPAILKVHPGQVGLLTFSDPKVTRVLALGSPGGGKTEAIVVRSVIDALELPNGISGTIAPTIGRLKIVWRKFLNLVGPLGWVEEVRPGDMVIILKNHHVIEFVAAKRQSSDLGSPIAGRDWQRAREDEQQNIDDESCREVDARGRIAKDFKVYSTATNEPLREFQVRLQEYRTSDTRKVLPFNGYENVFTPLEHWDRLKREWPKDEWERRIMGLDVPLSGRVYPMFTHGENISSLPKTGIDVTEEITAEKYGHPYRYIIGVDFGRLVTASVVLQAFRGASRDDRLWWAVHEFVTIDKPTDWHAKSILERYDPREFICVADPHLSSGKDVDKSDYTIFKRHGINVVRASSVRISRKHRFSMVNAMFCAADSKRRLFVDCDEHKRPTCPKLVESASHLLYGPNGEPETHKKGIGDLTHYMDDLGYALYPFERLRGADRIHAWGNPEEV